MAFNFKQHSIRSQLDPANIAKRTATVEGLVNDSAIRSGRAAVQLSIDSINLAIVFFSFVFYLCLRRWKPATHVVLPWFMYGSLVGIYEITTILAIATLSMYLNYGSVTAYVNNKIAIQFLRGITDIFLLVIFNSNIVHHILKQKNRELGFPTLVNRIALALIVVFAIPTYILFAYINVLYTTNDDWPSLDVFDLQQRQVKLAAVYYFLHTTAAVVASAFILSAMISPSAPRFTGRARFWAAVTCVAKCAAPLTAFAGIIRYRDAYMELDSGLVVLLVLELVPVAIAILGVLILTYRTCDVVYDDATGKAGMLQLARSKAENGEIAELGPAQCHEMPGTVLCHELPA